MLNIGWASRDVSTKEPVFISGQHHERISKGSCDPTTITVLVIDDGNDAVIFISGDFTSIYGELLCAVKEKVSAINGEIPTDKIIFNATHTHTAPRYHGLLGYDKAPLENIDFYAPDKYREFLADNVASAVNEAWCNKEPGSFAYGFGSAAIALPRKTTYSVDKGKNTPPNSLAVDGHGVMYGPTNDPDFCGYESTTDSNVYLLYTFDLEENLTGAIINVPCPSQCTENESFLSADFWHETRELIRKRFGNIFIMPQCAAAGDLSPHKLHANSASARRFALKYHDNEKVRYFTDSHGYYLRLEIAEKIASAFEECYDWAVKEKFTDASIKHVTKTVLSDAWKITEEDYKKSLAEYNAYKEIPFAKTDEPYADFKLNTIHSSVLARYEDIIRRYESDNDFVETEIHILRLGNIAFAACPFELYVDFQHRVQARSPFTQTFLVQLAASDAKDIAQDYLCTEKGAANKGYSANIFSCSVSPQGGNKLVEEIVDTLTKLH